MIHSHSTREDEPDLTDCFDWCSAATAPALAVA